MSTTSIDSLAGDCRALALEVHAALGELDPTRWRDDLHAATSRRLADLAERTGRLCDRSEARHAGLSEPLQEVADVLRDRPRAAADLWAEYRPRLHRAYDQLSAQLRDLDVHVPAVRPSNHARSAWHMGSSACVAGLVIAAPPSWHLPVALTFAALAWGCEVVRRRSPAFNERLMSVFGPLAHPHEHQRVNSTTYFVTGMLLMALWADPWACALGVFALGFGDPVAALVGRRWGRIHLVHGRTLEGAVAFVIASWIPSYAALAVVYPEISRPMVVALVASLTGAVVELFSKRLDDNMTIPLAAAAGATAALALL